MIPKGSKTTFNAWQTMKKEAHLLHLITPMVYQDNIHLQGCMIRFEPK